MRKLVCTGIGLLAALSSAPICAAIESNRLPALSSPATRPSEDVSPLIRQLGDDDFRVRMSASQSLQAMGPAAVPALQCALASNDPEVQVRARDIISRIQHPVERDSIPQVGGDGRRSLRVSVRSDGSRSYCADEPGRRTQIDIGPAGICMRITGMLNGIEVAREYKAATPEILRQAHPQAYCLYQQLVRQVPAFGMGKLPLQLPVQLHVEPRPAGSPAPAIIPQLGVTVDPAPAGDGVTIVQVIPSIRWEHIELQPHDRITLVNGQPVHSPIEFRRLVGRRPGAVTLEGVRDGKPLKLQSQP